MSQILNLSLNENIVNYTTNHILKLNDSKTDFSSIAVVMPSKRPAMFIKKEISKIINNSYIPPQFFTFDELVKEISNIRNIKNISTIDSSYIIYEIVQNNLKTSKFYNYTYSSFFQWANEILNFINLLDLEKINEDKVSNIQLQAQIGFDVPESINELLQNISFIREQYHKKLDSLNKTTLAYSYYNATKYVSHYLKDFKNIILFNPYYLNKSETDLFKVVFDEGKLDVIIRGNTNNWKCINKIYTDFNVKQQTTKDKICDNIKFYNSYDGQSQGCLVKNLVQQLPKDELQNTVVIVPDNTILQAVTSELYSFCKDINIAVGYPAQKTTIFSLMNDLVKAHLNRVEDNKYYVKDLISIISNPLVKNIRFIGMPDITRIIVHEIVKNFDVSNKKALFKLYQFISLDEILNNNNLIETISKKVTAYWQEVSSSRIKEIITQMFNLFFYNIANSNTMKTFAIAIINIADIIIQKSLISSYAFNIGAINIIYDIANQLKKSICSINIFKQTEILKIFEYILSKGSINLVGSPLKGLQVLGFMESRGLSFDNVFVVSMADSVVPKITDVNPLIPKEVINFLNVGYIDREIDIQKYNFYSLIAGAKNVSLIYPKDNNNIRSRFIEELIWKKQYNKKSLKVVNINNAVIPTQIFYNTKPEFIKTDKIKQYLSNFNYSATSIDTYLKCKLKFYYQYIMKLNVQVDYDADYENINIGVCIHDFLNKNLHKGIKKEDLNEEYKKQYDKSLDEFIDFYFENSPKGKLYLLEKLLKNKLNEFYNNEQNRNFREILNTEFDVSGKIEVNGKEYNLTSRIDRLDFNEDNTLSIIDYKTGSIEAPITSRNYNDKDELTREIISKNIRSFQLILYKYLYEKKYNKEVSNIMLYCLKDCSIQPLVITDKRPFESFVKQLKVIIADINSNEPFKSEEYDKCDCKKCPYFFICK